MKKWGRAAFYLSRHYSWTVYFLVKTLLIKSKNLYTSACLNLNYGTEKQWVSFWSLFQLSGKTVSENLNLKFRSKFNHDFTNNGCLHCVILKSLSNFKETDNFKILNVRFLRSSKCLKTIWNLPGQPVELAQKLETNKTAPHLWHSCIVTVVSHYYDVAIDGR